MQAKIIQFDQYANRTNQANVELKNDRRKIKQALDRIDRNLIILKKYQIKK